MSTRRALLIAVILASAACERVAVGPSATAIYTEEADEAAFVYTLQPRFFDALGDAALSLPDGMGDLTWQDSLQETLADGSLLQLSPLDTTFELLELRLQPKPTGLALSARYRSDPIRSRVLLQADGETSICPLEIDLQERALELVLTPGVGTSRQPRWEAEILAGFTAAGDVTWTETEPCSFDLASLDWSLISRRIDSRLAGQVTGAFGAELRAMLSAELGLPVGGLLLTPLETGFFAPRQTQIASWVSQSPPWSGAGLQATDTLGVRAAFDVWSDVGEASGCVAGLSARENAPTPITSVPDAPPSGAPHDALALVDAGALHATLDQLVLGGHLCLDDQIRLSDLLPELALVPLVDLEADGQLRLQPLSMITASITDAGEVRVELEGFRGHLYGVLDEALVQIASWEASFSALTQPRLDASGALRLEILSSEVTVLASERALLDTLGVELETEVLAARVGENLIERGTVIPLPRPFGRAFELVELSQHEGAWAFFLALTEAAP